MINSNKRHVSRYKYLTYLISEQTWLFEGRNGGVEMEEWNINNLKFSDLEHPVL